MTTEVRYTATQRAGLRGIGFEAGLFAVSLAVAPVERRTVLVGVPVPLDLPETSGGPAGP